MDVSLQSVPICNQVFKNKAYLGQQILRRNFIEPFVVKTSSVYL